MRSMKYACAFLFVSLVPTFASGQVCDASIPPFMSAAGVVNLISTSVSFDGTDDSLDYGAAVNDVLSDGYDMRFSMTPLAQPGESGFIAFNDAIGISYRTIDGNFSVWVQNHLGLLFTSSTLVEGSEYGIAIEVREGAQGTSLDLFIDGALAGSDSSANNTLFKPAQPFVIGSNSGTSSFFSGVLSGFELEPQ